MRVTLLLAAGILLSGCQVMRAPESMKAEVASAAKAWADAFNKCDPGRIAALYDREAVLWGTVSPTITTTPDGVRQYFERACASPIPPKVAFGDQELRIYGDTATNSGLYTFTITRDGKAVPIPARYTFSYRMTEAQWLIIAHHSSLRPAPPKP